MAQTALKPSIHNSVFLTPEGITLVYNAFSDDFLATNISDIAHGHHLDTDIIARYPELEEQLIRIQALVPADLDEVNRLREVIAKVDNDPTQFHLHVNPTLDCNFRCWYCYETHQPGSRMSSGMVKATKRLITKTVDGNPDLRHFVLSFFGGEPLIGFNDVALPIMRHCQEECGKAGISFISHFTTNSYLITDSIIKAIADFPVNFQITLDGAPEDHDKVRYTADGKGSYNRIIENIRKLAGAGKHVIARVNYTKANLQGVGTIVDDIIAIPEESHKYLKMDFQRVWQDRKDELEPEVTEILEQYAARLTEADISSSTHYMNCASIHSSCYGDKRNYALINFNGDVYQCSARDFKPEHRSGTLDEDGSISWKPGVRETRMEQKYIREICHECRIAPLCAGGCRQQAVERIGQEGCLYKYSGQQMDDLVLDRFLYRFSSTSTIN